MTTNTIGLNPFKEPVFEDPGARRFVFSCGIVLEETPSDPIRFMRPKTPEDARIGMESLLDAEILASFGSVTAAACVYTARPGHPPQDPAAFLILFEACRRRRFFSALISNVWPSSFTPWSDILCSQGASGFSLAYEACVFAAARNKPADYDALAARARSLIAPGSSSRIVEPSGLVVQSGHPGLPKELICMSAAMMSAPASIARPLHALYRSFSDPANSTGHANPLLNHAYDLSAPPWSPQKCMDVLTDRLGSSSSNINITLSPEQRDSVLSALRRLDAGSSFIVADETGYGKGRILAAVALAALQAGRPVFFLTEKKSLFHDFLRDVNHVFPSTPPIASIAHSGLSKKALKVIMGEQGVLASPNADSKWVWSTYSQFSRKDREKEAAVLSWVKKTNAWVLFDETQNASGTSNTNDFAQSLVASANACVFASATFAKNESQLSLYRPLFGSGASKDWARVVSGFSSDSAALRFAMTVELAANGAFLRREHPPVDPPAVRLSSSAASSPQRDAVASFWRSVRSALLVWQSATDNRSPPPWMKMGEPLARCLREMSMIQKIPDVVSFLVECRQQGRKAVLVSDWTLSSHLDEGDDGLPVDGLWKTSWRTAALTLFDSSMIAGVSADRAKAMRDALQSINDAAEILPDWSASPFDEVSEAAKAAGINLVEVSGRARALQKNESGFSVVNRPPVDRVQAVGDFNSGRVDALLITRAANSGNSLHASEDFQDRRQRHMLEWDVPPDPSVRLQFWGRVRRKGQVSEPIVETLLLETPAELRRASRDIEKQTRLRAHSGSDIPPPPLSWTSDAHRNALSEWASSNPTQALELGVHQGGDPDRILARSVLLGDAEADRLIRFVAASSKLVLPWFSDSVEPWSTDSRPLRSEWWFGAGANELRWSERIWDSSENPPPDLQSRLSALSAGLLESDQLVAAWGDLLSGAPPLSAALKDATLLSDFKKNAALWKKGSALSVLDPITRQRKVAVVVGWSFPDEKDSGNRQRSLVGVTLWLAGAAQELETSLSALIGFGQAKPLNRKAHPRDLLSPAPLRACVLEGPAWSCAAWGARSSPHGRLIRLPSSSAEPPKWGWVMPSHWSWDQMLSTHRELSGPKQATYFWSAFPGDSILWSHRGWARPAVSRTEAGQVIFSCVGRDMLQWLSNATRNQSSARFDQTTQAFMVAIPWSCFHRAAASLVANGALMCVEARHSAWLRLKTKSTD